MKLIRGHSLVERYKSIRAAYFVPFVIFLTTAMICFTVISLNYTYMTATDNATTYSDHITAQVNYDIDSYIESMQNISDIVSKSSDVQKYLFDATQTEEERTEACNRILSEFSTVLDSRSDIYNIAAVSDRDISVVNRGDSTVIPYTKLSTQQWFKDTMSNPDGVSISGSHVQNAISSSYQWVITLSRPIIDNSTGKIHGIFFVDLNYTVISNLCNINKIGDKGYVFIIDDSGKLIYHPQQQLIYGGLKTENIKEALEANGNSFTVGKGTDSRLYTCSASEKTGWTAVGVSYVSELTKNDSRTLAMYILLSVGILIVALAVSSLISREITMPIFDLLSSMKKVAKGEFEQSILPVRSANEIGQLTAGFNSMTMRIEDLVKENIREQEEKRKSELRALQSQINPHFLYNTLDSIIWMAEAGKNEEVVQMTAALSRLFRQGISVEDEVILLPQEISYCESYLLIQKFRFQDKLEYEVTTDDSLRYVSIVKMVLQPIIENAINHGVKLKEGKGHLTVRTYREGDNAVIEIADDGVGMDKDTLSHIFEHHHVNRSKNGVGIYNVQRRLQLYYGDAYGISYTSEPGVGTTAKVTIPIEKEDRHEETG